jgi:hypothetical protein
MPGDTYGALPLPGLSPVAGKPIIVLFGGGSLSSDGGLLALCGVEARVGVAERLVACIDDSRAPERIQHGLAAMLGFRLLMIAASYADGNDADSLRHDPLFKLANGRLPGEAALWSPPTLSRLEKTLGPRALIRMAAPWWRSTAPASARSRAASRSTSTTPSTPGTAGSNCDYSTPTTTNEACSRLSCSTARAVSSPPCCIRPDARPVPRHATSCVVWCTRSAAPGRASRF